MEVRMELRALRARHAVDGPDAALLAKRTVIGRMPVPRGEDRKPAHAKRGHITVQDRDDLVASRYSKRAAWQEIILEVHDQQAIAGMEVHVNPPRSLLLIVYPKRRRRQLHIFDSYRMKRGAKTTRGQATLWKSSLSPFLAVVDGESKEGQHFPHPPGRRGIPPYSRLLGRLRTRSQSPLEWFARTSSRRRPPLPCPGNSCIRHGARDRSAWIGVCNTAP